MKNSFASLLLKWYAAENHRPMPWKGEKNAYLIWLSEIILQQTRVEQGLPYFLKFKKKFPTIKKLANASEDEVLHLWQGLGYYSRARNLHLTAKNIHQNYGGRFPSTFQELKKLKGIGDYTAAAIGSFAFGQKYAVVDGNVIRVLSRHYGIKTAFDTTTGKKEFAALAQQLIDESNPALYNQAIMDFGSQVCLPKKPHCSSCPFSSTCFAYHNRQITLLPYRAKRNKITNRYFNYILLTDGNEIFIQKRTGNDIWENLYQLPLSEEKNRFNTNIRQTVKKATGLSSFKITGQPILISQLLSHRKIHFRFITISVAAFSQTHLPACVKVKRQQLSRYAFPKTIRLVLEQNSLL